MSSETDSIELKMPSIVGPNLYELYTDAGLYITRVFVNGIERKLSNAEGNGMTIRNGHSFSGPMGYSNKTILNAHMHKGDNEIKVVFEPSSIVSEVIKKEFLSNFIKDIFARVLIVRGILKENNLGITTENVDELIAADNPGVDVLADKFVTVSAADSLNKPLILNFNVNVPEDEIGYQGQIQSCEGDFRSSYNFTANLLLNGTPLLHIENNTSTRIEAFNKIVQPLTNTLVLQVISINDKTKDSYFEYYIECEMEDIIKKIGLEPAHSNVSFGDFFNRLHLQLWTLKIGEEGNYTADFDFYY